MHMQGEVGFHKQPTHRRRGDEPFFYSGVDRSWLGIAQKWSILDEKWANMAGLSTFQSGSKGSKRVHNDQPKCFWPFGPIWTLLGNFKQKWFFAPNGQKVLRRCHEAKNQFLVEMVQKGSRLTQKGLKWRSSYKTYLSLLTTVTISPNRHEGLEIIGFIVISD